MKLSHKIFLGICIPSIIAILVILSILVNKNFETSLNNETDRCIQEFKFIENNVEDSMNNSTSTDEGVVIAYAEYYATKKIDLLYYEDGKCKFSSENYKNINNDDLLGVHADNVLVKTQKVNNEYSIFISTRLENGQVLIYARDINQIYNMKNYLIRLSVISILASILCIAILAYYIAKSLTKPLVKLGDEMKKVSKGNYDINLKTDNSEIGKLAKSFNDMSNEIKNRNDELINNANSKQVFIDNLSHEINTPLTSIIGYSELLEKANCSDEQRIKFLRNIQEEAKRIGDMHKKLLFLSYKKNADLDMKFVSVENILEEVKRTTLFKLENKNISLMIENSLKEIYCDETLIIMCISNLVSNAANASADGSEIMIKGFYDNNIPIIQVIDQGHGISKENIEKILEPFYRVDKARSRKNGGAGLGLSICKNIMDLHHGEIKIESEEGKGSVFTIEFTTLKQK